MAIYAPQNILLPLRVSFLPVSEAVLEVPISRVSSVVLSCLLSILNKLKILTFRGHFDLGEEPELCSAQSRE